MESRNEERLDREQTEACLEFRQTPPASRGGVSAPALRRGCEGDVESVGAALEEDEHPLARPNTARQAREGRHRWDGPAIDLSHHVATADAMLVCHVPGAT
jgi:hypothetical protein